MSNPVDSTREQEFELSSSTISHPETSPTRTSQNLNSSWPDDHVGADHDRSGDDSDISLLPARTNRRNSFVGRKCFFYVATGENYRNEVIASVRSLRVHMPHAHVTLYTDRSVDGPFDEVVILESPTFSFGDKVAAFERVRYEKAVFLDTDTYIAAPIDDLFVLLDHVDFAASTEVARGYWYDAWNIPDSFPEFNTGVVAFRRTPAVTRMLRSWRQLFEESKRWQEDHTVSRGNPWDQPPLRKALYDSREVRFAVLPTEYNALRHDGTYLWGRAKIVHGRGNIATVEKRMNRNPNVERVFFQGLGVVAPMDKLSLWSVLEFAARTNAVVIRDLLWRVRRLFRGARSRNS